MSEDKTSTSSTPSPLTFSNLKTQAAKVGADAINSKQRFMSLVNKTMNPSKPKRPDMIFLRNILLFVAALTIVYYALPRLSASVKTGFSSAQFQKATRLPESAFNIEEMAKVNQEVKAFQDHKSFFDDGGAFSANNAGLREINRTSTALPMLIFFLQFVLPPLAIGYIIWFVLTYWKYVWAALWGFFLAMYSYFTTLIQGRLGCKWYIRWVTGWRCRSPQFSTYVINWRKQYIDRPMYIEKMKYVAKYLAVKDRYITQPYKKYISNPLASAAIKTDYARKITTDRTVEVILKKARDASAFGSIGLVGQAYGYAFKKDLEDATYGYESETITGKSCKCPSAADPLKNAMGKVIDGVDRLRDAVPNKFETNDTVNNLINDKASITGSIIVMLIAMLIGAYMYSWTYGTPALIKNLLSQTNYITANKTFKRWPVAPYVGLATVFAFLAHIGFN